MTRPAPLPYLRTIDWPRWRCDRVDGVQRVVWVRAERELDARLKVSLLHDGHPDAWRAERTDG